MNHMTWQRRGLADDAPSSPFHVLRITAQEREHTGPIKDRNYSLLNQTLPLPTTATATAAASLSPPPSSSSPTKGASLTLDPDVSTSSIDYWSKSYANPHLPLVVDLGCGAGRFCLYLAYLLSVKDPAAMQSLTSSLPLLLQYPSDQQSPEFNILGIDIQAALVNRAKHWAANRPHLKPNLHYCVANANSSTSQLLASYPGPIALACIQYPDPHERTDRHVVNDRFVSDLAGWLPIGARVLLQSELEATASHMRDEFQLHGSNSFTPLNPARRKDNDEDPSTSGHCYPHEGMQDESLPSEASVGVKTSYTGGVRERARGAQTVKVKGTSSLLEEDRGDLSWRRDFDWIELNPIGDIPTEREVYMRQELPGERVYRFMIKRV